jgi:hypothetical protein
MELGPVDLRRLLDLLQNTLPTGLRFPQTDLHFTLTSHATAEIGAASPKP